MTSSPETISLIILKYFKRNIFDWLHKIRYFVIPNLYPIIKKKIQIGKNCNIQQALLCEGKGHVIIGSNCSFGYKLGGFWKGGTIELQARYSNAQIVIGNNVATNNNIFFCAANYIEIGDDTLIGQNVTVMDHEAHDINPQKRNKLGVIGKVIIGENVWIGSNVTILKNSEIGNNSIVASGALVLGRFPENVIIGGIPAKIIKPI